MKKHFCDLCNSEIDLEDDSAIYFMNAGFTQYSKNRNVNGRKYMLIHLENMSYVINVLQAS